ncbi:MlaD family protein [Rhodopirellula sallentina]|uniref:MlaD family protein n=1 Tax=Rhodopirellula sallentina TaxID=1263869 RepID=UPI000693788F|nr:MlaD family protein [Rhodopirellula sallentina]
MNRMSETGFPESDVVARKRGIGTLAWSPMWIVTLVCAILAVALTYAAYDEPGVWVKIRFDRGHGLKVGDVVMYRGIEVGRVGELNLRGELDGIDVHVILERDAAMIASEGSRFWIVRPQVNVQGISGLETAIGSKYLSVIPGDSGQRQTEFDGLETPPPLGADRGGMEVVLRGDDRWGVNPGSPLSFRGIEVGQVLGSSLSPDARHVDTRVKIDARHLSLLSKDSKFWVTSGVQMDLGMSGLKLSAESLSTIARGGIAFITPAPVQPGEAVQPGEVFRLHRKMKQEWIDRAAAINQFASDPPKAIRVRADWTESFFGIARSKSLSSWALVISMPEGGDALLVPANVLRAREEAVDDSFRINVLDGDATLPVPVEGLKRSGPAVAGFAIDAGEFASANIRPERLRVSSTPEDVYAVSWRAVGSDSSSLSSEIMITEMIGRDQLRPDGDQWRVLDTVMSADVWNGAPVIAAADEKLIGMLVVRENETVIVRVNSLLGSESDQTDVSATK